MIFLDKRYLLALFLTIFPLYTSAKKAQESKEKTSVKTAISLASKQPVTTTETKPKEKVATKKTEPVIKLSKADTRKHKTKKGTKKRHTLRDMDYDELKITKNKRIEAGDIDGAIKFAEKMVPMCKDMNELKELTLELADLYFKHGELEKAGKLYVEFTKLYPGNDQVELAYYRAIQCSFSGILDAERDQTKTRDALELTNKFLERGDVFTKYNKEVKALQEKCYEQLVESEKGIISYYADRKQFKAATSRVESMKKDIQPHAPKLEPQLLALEYNLAIKQNDMVLAQATYEKLNTKFPDFAAATVSSPNTVLAQTGQKKSFYDRF